MSQRPSDTYKQNRLNSPPTGDTMRLPGQRPKTYAGAHLPSFPGRPSSSVRFFRRGSPTIQFQRHKYAGTDRTGQGVEQEGKTPSNRDTF